MHKIAAGIVLYNPDDINRFMTSLHSVVSQVNRVYIFDNSDENVEMVFPNNVEYITEKKNFGIAYALNRIMEMAKRDGYTWVVTMDQDSILPDNIIAEYEKYIDDCQIGIICPQVIDSRRTYMELKKAPEKEFIQECITSGSCTSVEVWERVGKFDEWLFIDLVDNEFCKRVVLCDYKILRINTMVMNQEFGKIKPKSINKQEFWIKLSKIFNNQNIAKFSYIKYVSPLRVYYTNRNIIYVNKKLKKYGPVAYSNYNCKGYVGFWFCFCLPSFFRAKKKWQVLKAIVQGVSDGVRKEVEVWDV